MQWVKMAKNNKTNMICFICTNMLLISDGVILLIKRFFLFIWELRHLSKNCSVFQVFCTKNYSWGSRVSQNHNSKIAKLWMLRGKAKLALIFTKKKSVIFFTKTDRLCTSLVKINCLGGFCIFEPPYKSLSLQR